MVEGDYCVYTFVPFKENISLNFYEILFIFIIKYITDRKQWWFADFEAQTGAYRGLYENTIET